MPSARHKLELSHLKLTQQELMGEDYDVEEIKLQIKGVTGLDLSEALVDANCERTIEGASTLTLTVVDHDRLLLRSGRLHSKADVKIDGLWFRLVSVSKNSDLLDLVFEDREIAILRTYSKVIKASQKTSRYEMTRAKFILRLLREVKEFKIPYVIPELGVVQQVEEGGSGSTSATPAGGGQEMSFNRGAGIPHGAGHKKIYLPSGGAGEPHAQKVITALTVKGSPMTDTQIDNANIVLDKGVQMNCGRALLVMSMMCCIQESSLINLKQPSNPNTISGTSAGLFQEIAGLGLSEAERRDMPNSARRFFTRLKSVNHQEPNAPYWQQIADTQRPREDLRTAYAPWRHEAEKMVTVYGAGNTAVDNSMAVDTKSPEQDYEFYRGKPKTVNGKTIWSPESSWACISRLADEVNWRAFFVSGTFYYMSEDQLFKAKPAAIIDESSDGIIAIDGEYDIGKNTSELRITCQMGQWQCAPGTTIQIVNCGPLNGKWLVSNVSRGLFDPIGEITVKKPRPRLPEPAGDNIKDPTSWSALTGNPQENKPHDPNLPFSTTPLRDKIIKGAMAVKRAGIHYNANEPNRSSGVSNRIRLPKTPKEADCSSFATWCYWQAGAPDPSNYGYSTPVGNTTSMHLHGKKVSMQDAKPGDLCLYGDLHAGGSAAHVTVYLGNGKCIGVGGDPDPTESEVHYRDDFREIRNYLGD